MKTQVSIKELIPYAVIIALLIMQFLGKSFFGKSPKETITIDSTLVVKNTLEKKGEFRSEKPQPIVVVVPSQTQPNNDAYINRLLSELSSIKETDKQQSKLLKELALRVYEKTYQDSTVTITVKDSINGHLQSQNVQWTVKPQKVKYYEKTITKKLKPKFTLSAGIGVASRLDSLANPQLKGIIGFKNKKGYELQLGASTDRVYSLTLKKDLFSSY